jgi:hypothetical protein
MLRKEAKPWHTRQYLETQQRRHYSDTRRPDHDHIQAMTAVKEFGWKWIAVNPLDTIVFCMTQHQTVIKSKMTLASG